MAISESPSASGIQMDYMKLLITQLQNQNPLEPMDNNQMSSQLAQFAQLQELESMGSNFSKVLQATERSYANSLVGKNISFLIPDAFTGALEQKEGMVGEVYFDVDGNNFLVVDKHTLDLTDIAESLKGKEVPYLTTTEYGAEGVTTGVILDVVTDSATGESFFVIDGREISPDDIIVDSLVGSYVSYSAINELTGLPEDKRGRVNGVYKGPDGENILDVGLFIDLEEVVSVGS